MGKPRKPQNRGDVVSWSWFRLRERTAAVRLYVYEHPHRCTAAVVAPATLVCGFTLEHWQVTFPWIVATAQSLAA